MNPNQRLALILTVLMLAGSCLYVPWRLTFAGGGTDTAYGLVFAPPTRGYARAWDEEKSPAQSRRVDWGWLVTEWGILLTCGGTTTVAANKKDEIAPQR